MMSNTHLAIVREIKDVKGPARAVLMVLADHADEEGNSFPSWATIQREAGFKRSAVHGALQKLKTDGLVSWRHRRDSSGDLTSNLYQLSLPSPRDGRGSPRDGLPSPPDGRGVVHDMDGGSPLDGRRSINEAPSRSINEASLFQDGVLPKPETIPSKEKHLQKLAESIYHEYPKKTAKPDAIRAIINAMRENDPAFLIERTKLYAESIGWKDKQFIPYPATWFNKGMFSDDPAEWKQPGASKENFKGTKENLTLKIL